MDLLAEVNRELGVTVLVSLHQVDYAFAFCPRTVALRGGEIVYDGPTAGLTPARLQSLYGAQLGELGGTQTPASAPVAQPRATLSAA